MDNGNFAPTQAHTAWVRAYRADGWQVSFTFVLDGTSDWQREHADRGAGGERVRRTRRVLGGERLEIARCGRIRSRTMTARKRDH